MSLRVSWVPPLATGDDGSHESDDDGSDGHDVFHLRSHLHDSGYDATFVHVVRCMRRDPSTDGTTSGGAGCIWWSRRIFSSHVQLDPFVLSRFRFRIVGMWGWSWTRMGQDFCLSFVVESPSFVWWEWMETTKIVSHGKGMPTADGMDRPSLSDSTSISISLYVCVCVTHRRAHHSCLFSIGWVLLGWGGVDGNGKMCLCDIRSETKGQRSTIPEPYSHVKDRGESGEVGRVPGIHR